MTTDSGLRPADEASRREIFAALVAAQDGARSIHEGSRGSSPGSG